MTTSIVQDSRYRQGKPCPICGGGNDDKRGEGVRCWGFDSGDGYAHCTRIGHPDLKFSEGSNAWAHYMLGPCRCGSDHRSGVAALVPASKPKGKPQRRRNVEHYPYRDAAGVVLYRATRQEPKSFFQSRPDGNGGWINDIKGVTLVPYRYPELLAADPGRDVWFCEGEKDCNRLSKLGLVATGTAMGAESPGQKHWKEGRYDAYLPAFAGRRVMILVDNDDRGREFSALVAGKLSQSAASVKLIELPGLPAKGDVSDYLDAGHDLAELVAYGESAPAWTPPAGGSVGFVGVSPQESGSAAGGSVGFVGTPGEEIPKFEGDPLPLVPDLLPVPPLDPAMIPEAFRGWLTDIAERGCFPPEYPTAAALCGLASVFGKKIVMRPKRHDDWYVCPNLWGAVVGPPGIQKTPAVEEALKPLKRLVADAIDEHDRAMERHKREVLIAEVKASAAKDLLKSAAKSKKSDAELESLASEALATSGTVEPVLRRYMVNDSTVEKLGELLSQNPNGLMLFRDELTGFLRSMEKQGHESDRGFYLESWNGLGGYTYDRIGRGTVHIRNVCLSIFGTIQPGPLSRYLKTAATGEDADGFVPRFQLLVFPDVPQSFRNIDRRPDVAAKDRAYRVFRWADELQPETMGCDYDADRDLYFLGFTDEAQGFFDGWREDLELRLRSGQMSPLLQGHLAKYRSLLPSLALLFHLIESAGDRTLGPVPLRAAEMAAAWCDLLEGHARRAYQVAMDGDPEAASRLAERIKQSLPNPFTYRHVVQKGWSGLDTTDAVRRAVGYLEDKGWVRVVETPTDPVKGGRPGEKVYIHPTLHSINGVVG